MTVYERGDRVLVPGKITGYNSDGEYDVTYASGASAWRHPIELRPDAGRDLTADDVWEAVDSAMRAGGKTPHYGVAAARLTRLARGGAERVCVHPELDGPCSGCAEPAPERRPGAGDGEPRRVLVMNKAGGRVADVTLDPDAFPDEAPTVWITEGMADTIEDQRYGAFWDEAARLTDTTGPNGRGWTTETRGGVLAALRAGSLPGAGDDEPDDARAVAAIEERDRRERTVGRIAAQLRAIRGGYDEQDGTIAVRAPLALDDAPPVWRPVRQVAETILHAVADAVRPADVTREQMIEAIMSRDDTDGEVQR